MSAQVKPILLKEGSQTREISPEELARLREAEQQHRIVLMPEADGSLRKLDKYKS